jgi:hypothetical protein
MDVLFMNDCYALQVKGPSAPQTPEDKWFIGGIPKLPPTILIPRCKLCKADQSFMFQIAFPDSHRWHGLSLAVFSCTSCADQNYLIPRMLSASLPGVAIPEGFLESYQTNFRFLVFASDEAQVRKSYIERVRFQGLNLEPVSPDFVGHKIGGVPNWLMKDETPASYRGSIKMFFLLQLQQGFQFEIHNHASPQIELGIDGLPQPSPVSYYQLFNGNAIYLFGTDDRSEPLVYAITQID